MNAVRAAVRFRPVVRGTGTYWATPFGVSVVTISWDDRHANRDMH